MCCWVGGKDQTAVLQLRVRPQPHRGAEEPDDHQVHA